jgi:hypothetical protein
VDNELAWPGNTFRARRLAWGLLLAILIVNLSAPGVLAADPTDDELARAIAERARWGVNADPDYVRELLATGQDVGTETVGLPMTEMEIAQLDLPGRAAFARQVRSELLPAAQNLTAYAGAYFAQEDGGTLHLSFTDRDTAREHDLLSRISDPLRPIVFDVAAASFNELRDALRPAWAEMDSLGLTAFEIGIDDRANVVVIAVDPAELSEAQVLQPTISERLGVPIDIRAGHQAVPHGCTDREHCTDPMRSGSVIRKGSTSGGRCTMGFHFRIGTNEQFMTAGHCGQAGSSNWYHRGYGTTGFVGSEKANLLYSGYDAMRIEMPDSQASNMMYYAYRIDGWEYPISGEQTIVSFGLTGMEVGTIERTWTSWRYSGSGSCECTVWGGSYLDTNEQGGDSGSPLYSYQGYAQGIHAAGDVGGDRAYYARVGDLMNIWGGDVVK